MKYFVQNNQLVQVPDSNAGRITHLERKGWEEISAPTVNPADEILSWDPATGSWQRVAKTPAQKAKDALSAGYPTGSGWRYPVDAESRGRLMQAAWMMQAAVSPPARVVLIDTDGRERSLTKEEILALAPACLDWFFTRDRTARQPDIPASPTVIPPTYLKPRWVAPEVPPAVDPEPEPVKTWRDDPPRDLEEPTAAQAPDDGSTPAAPQP